MKKRSIAYAILAALCYGVSAPISKILLGKLPPMLMAALLYLGAGFGMVAVNAIRRQKQKEAPITRKELPYTIAMVLLDIAAPVFLMIGLARTTSATASLLNNFEIVATTVIALVFFKEAVGKRMWIAIALITLASVLLSVENFADLAFSPGAGFVLLACVCWGVENNCTRMLSLKDPLQVVVIKGFGSGFGALLLSLFAGERGTSVGYIAGALLLGFVAYGLSIYFYILAQRTLGASRTSAYYAFAPFVGVGLSLILFQQKPSLSFLAALTVMIVGACFAAYEAHNHKHVHRQLDHEHRHNHQDGHHDHVHDCTVEGEHSHLHPHDAVAHQHPHTPDLHHVHDHRS